MFVSILQTVYTSVHVARNTTAVELIKMVLANYANEELPGNFLLRESSVNLEGETDLPPSPPDVYRTTLPGNMRSYNRMQVPVTTLELVWVSSQIQH